MRLLTIEGAELTLDEWENLGTVSFGTPTADLIPLTHYNARSIDTFLDHLAISRTLDEIYDHPVEVSLAAGGTDFGPGIRIPEPLIPEEDFLHLTHDLSVVPAGALAQRAHCSPLLEKENQVFLTYLDEDELKGAARVVARARGSWRWWAQGNSTATDEVATLSTAPIDSTSREVPQGELGDCLFRILAELPQPREKYGRVVGGSRVWCYSRFLMKASSGGEFLGVLPADTWSVLESLQRPEWKGITVDVVEEGAVLEDGWAGRRLFFKVPEQFEKVLTLLAAHGLYHPRQRDGPDTRAA